LDEETRTIFKKDIQRHSNNDTIGPTLGCFMAKISDHWGKTNCCMFHESNSNIIILNTHFPSFYLYTYSFAGAKQTLLQKVKAIVMAPKYLFACFIKITGAKLFAYFLV